MHEFLINPRKSYLCAVAGVIHFGTAVMIGMFSIKALVLGFAVPMLIGTAVGTYLFYAQHNFPGVVRRERHEWDYVWAALNSSSYMKMSPVMHWFTGNIGYHHVHHLNSKIPFYRLPEAMAGIPELQTPLTTSLKPADIWGCLRLKLWDPVKEQLVTWREAKLAQQQEVGSGDFSPSAAA